MENQTQTEQLESGAVILRGFASANDSQILTDINSISLTAPFRNMMTPFGHAMSVGMTNCGNVGWISDKLGYRYSSTDPLTNKPWPQLPNGFLELAKNAADAGGFFNFDPDCCLINKYTHGNKLSLHKDYDERDFSQPIVSVSLGIPCLFLWGSSKKTTAVKKIKLYHGDIVVFGGNARLNYHGIAPIRRANHSLTGNIRYNLTFRKAV